ncbi:MAG: tRNA (adenosine(37)-N6)-dimethylallyltransferase MiaA [Rubrivivax sp.]|nr:tRNA (adenosine(37)-N6)-dimethylallyltransferase MiaA [Rubrivivax sp.]
MCATDTVTGDRVAGEPAAATREEPPLLGLCLAGPTGAGKTALALAFARAAANAGTRVEIISVDSALVYRGMDIGTAKPAASERAQVPHHLIDILDPREAYSAAAFAADATRLAAQVRGRGALPLLVGGTMLYFKALRDGLDAMPAADAEVRAALDTEAAARGWPALHSELARVDPASAARLAPRDAQRIQRALEVWRVSGRTLSSWQAGRDTRPDMDLQQRRARWPLVSLEPRSRAWLHARIGERFAAMLAAGLLDEVRALRGRGDLQAGLPSMRCVGYRQAWAALDSGRIDELAATGAAATRQLAKRQLTWLRSMPDRLVVACDAEDAQARGVALLLQVSKRGVAESCAP